MFVAYVPVEVMNVHALQDDDTIHYTWLQLCKIWHNGSKYAAMGVSHPVIMYNTMSHD